MTGIPAAGTANQTPQRKESPLLVLSRHVDGRIFIGDGKDLITITVVEIEPGRVRLGFEAPSWFGIWREELAPDGVLPERKVGE